MAASQHIEAGFAPLELRDRAVRFVAERGGAAEDELLAHVYGGPPPSVLRARLAAPLLADPRLERRPDGSWAIRGVAPRQGLVFTALALVATGPRPERAAIVRIAALHVEGDNVVERFDTTLKPQRRVPRYVLARLGLEPDALDGQRVFGDILDGLVQFLGDRPVLAQDAHLTWAFLDAEARRLGRVLVELPLLDLNELAARGLDLKGKPTLSLVAAQLGIGTVQIAHADDEARVLALVGRRLLTRGPTPEARPASTTLRRSATVRSLSDEPGVYVLRDEEQAPLYVGKARRLRSRMAAYVHRPLGATRRLEGLVAAVRAVDTTHCATDLEALILEDREIRRLQPRYNTVRQQRAPRYWLRLPPPPPESTKRRLAPPRLELSSGPGSADGEFVGPFRNEAVAEQARLVARAVFELDELRRTDRARYTERLAQAWAFLHGETGPAEALARQRSTALLRQVVAFDVGPMLLPADPRHARYAVLRPGPTGVEGFLLVNAVFSAWTTLDKDGDTFAFAHRLLAPAEPRTTPEDAAVVLRWFGAQRPPARLVPVPDDSLVAADAIEDAALALTTGEA